MTSAHAPVPMTALLAHREWVRRLARSLVHDDASADDLEQRTWVAALRSPPGHATSVRAWLARVVRRQALDSFRAHGRRERHESAAARGESVRSAADVVAEAETQRRVVAAVCALAEPYRTTVLLRFFEDLPPREVARRLGVPVETVRTRQKRAAEMLRRELGGTDGSEWLAALTPLLAAPHDAGPGLGTAGGIVMRTSTKAAVVALAVVAAGALVWLVLEAARDDAGGRTVAATDHPASAATVARPDERSTAREPRTQRSHSDESGDPSAAPAAATGAAPPASTTALRDAYAEFEKNAVAVTSAPRPSGRTPPLPTPWNADDLLELLAKPAEPAVPVSELADDAAAFARGFVPRKVGETVDALRADPAATLADGTHLVFPAGCHTWDTSALSRNGVAFPQDLVVEGAGMDETLVVPTAHLTAVPKVGGITFRNLTVHCNDSCLIGVGVCTVRFDHVRVIGFDSIGPGGGPAGTGDFITGQAIAFLAQDCRFESGFGSTPGKMNWFLGTSPCTTPQSGWLTIARFERCRFVGPFAKPFENFKISVFHASPPGATVYSRCDLVDVTPLDRELIDHPERTPAGWTASYVRFEDCRVSYAPPPDGTPRKRRDVSEINPAWRMPSVPTPK
jgi:RNA polymerase sigma factor (sigma-70 family)